MNKNRLRIADNMPTIGRRIYRTSSYKPFYWYDFSKIPCIKGLYIQ